MAVDTQKFLALPPAKKGGDLASAIKPKESSKKTVGGKLIVIKTKIVKASDILKGTLAAEKKNINDQRKIDEKNKRSKKEEEIEQPKEEDKDAKKLKIKLPAFSWLDAIKNFIFTVLFGWAAVRLLKFLPELVKLLKPLAAIASFIMKVGELILKSLVTLVDWGYKAYEWTRGAVGTVFGQDGVKKFDQISGVLNKVLNLTMTLALGMIALSNEFGTNLIDFGKNFIRLFKHGFGKRLLKRILIQTLGKKTTAKILTKLGIKAATKTAVTTAATKAAVTTTATATTGAAKLGGMAVGVKLAVVGSAMALASALGEGMFQLKKQSQKKEEDSYEKFNDKGWWNPMKYFWGAVHLMDKFSSYVLGTVGVILDIVGTPFRYLIELIRYPFLSEEGKKKQNKNMAKFDARIREQFREMINAFSLGLLAKEKGAFGSLFGKKGTDAMGYTKDGKPIKKDKKEVVDTKKGEVEGKTPPLPKTNKDEVKTPQKIDKIFKSRRSGAEYDLSKSMGGLSRKEWDALDTIERKRILQRQTIWQSQNKKEWSDNIKGNANNIVPLDVDSVKKKTNNISKSTSYEETGGETVVVKSGSETGGDLVPETETKESIAPLIGGGGGGDTLSEPAALQYKKGG